MRSGFSFASSAAALLLCLLPALAAAAPAAEVTHTSGVSIVRRVDGSSKVLAPKSSVEQGDVVVTSQNAYARLKFSDGGEVTLRPNTQLRIARYRFEPEKPQEDSLILGLLKGGLRTITGLIGKRDQRSYELQTITATIGVRGTGFGVQSCQGGDCQGLSTVDGRKPDDGVHLDVFEGRVEIANQQGSLLVSAGEFAYVKQLDVAPITVPRGDAVPMTVPSFDAPQQGSPLDSGCVVR